MSSRSIAATSPQPRPSSARCCARTPAFIAPTTTSASCSARKGDRPGAVASLRRAAALQPDDASAIYNLAILARDFGADRASERAAYERALALDADLEEAHLALGTLLADPATPAALRDEAKARAHLTRFLAAASDGDTAGRKQAKDWLTWLDASAAARRPKR